MEGAGALPGAPPFTIPASLLSGAELSFEQSITIAGDAIGAIYDFFIAQRTALRASFGTIFDAEFGNKYNRIRCVALGAVADIRFHLAECSSAAIGPRRAALVVAQRRRNKLYEMPKVAKEKQERVERLAVVLTELASADKSKVSSWKADPLLADNDNDWGWTEPMDSDKEEQIDALYE